MRYEPKGLTALHSAVILFALSGLFAKWLPLAAIDIVFARAFFACVILGVVLFFIKRQGLSIAKRQLFGLIITGIILAFHWSSFFQAIQLSSVGIGLLTFASFPAFVAIIEPIVFRERYQWSVFFQVCLTLIGVCLILPTESANQSMVYGAYWGILSAFSFAILTIVNRKFVTNVCPVKVAFYQNGIAAIVLLPFIGLITSTLAIEHWGLLLILGVVFTALSHTLFNFSLKYISGQTASIAVSLEPVYGIIAAYFLLAEPINSVMVLGGSFIIIANIWAMLNKRKRL